MRLIGDVQTRQHAERVSAYLMTEDISTHCELDGETWQLWVRDEDQIGRSTELLDEFRKDPENPKYRKAVDEAQKIARERERKAQQARSNQVQMTSDRWNAPITKVAPLTVALIAISIAVSVLTNFGELREEPAFRALALGSITHAQAIDLVGEKQLDSFNTRLRMASLSKGQLWRSITPIFIHFDFWHLAFNMMWMVYLGKQIEFRFGSKYFAFLVILFAIPSNIVGCVMPSELDGVGIAQLTSHWTILAGGMSGVVYGLFGFVWIKMIFDPKSGMYISLFNSAIILIWLVACMHPDFPFGNVNNWAHGVGLVVGMIAGYWGKMVSDLRGSKPTEK